MNKQQKAQVARIFNIVFEDTPLDLKEELIALIHHYGFRSVLTPMEESFVGLRIDLMTRKFLCFEKDSPHYINKDLTYFDAQSDIEFIIELLSSHSIKKTSLI